MWSNVPNWYFVCASYLTVIPTAHHVTVCIHLVWQMCSRSIQTFTNSVLGQAIESCAMPPWNIVRAFIKSAQGEHGISTHSQSTCPLLWLANWCVNAVTFLHVSYHCKIQFVSVYGLLNSAKVDFPFNHSLPPKHSWNKIHTERFTGK